MGDSSRIGEHLLQFHVQDCQRPSWWGDRVLVMPATLHTHYRLWTSDIGLFFFSVVAVFMLMIACLYLQALNYSNPMYTKIYLEEQSCVNPAVTRDERRELLPKILETTVQETAT